MYLRAACLPLNVVENLELCRLCRLDRAQGIMRGIRCALRVNIGKGKPAIPSSTLLAFATFFNFPPTHLEEGSRGAQSEKTGHRDPSVLFLLPGHPVINPIYPTPVGIGVTVVCVGNVQARATAPGR